MKRLPLVLKLQIQTKKLTEKFVRLTKKETFIHFIKPIVPWLINIDCGTASSSLEGIGFSLVIKKLDSSNGHKLSLVMPLKMVYQWNTS
jgi:hypothetical protein